MDDETETAWDEINPRTGLAPRPEQPSALSATSTNRLAPATKADQRRELTACLALTAPVGMTEADRTAWFIAAYGTLSHLPADLLAIGCQKARIEADHPSKIVPIIVRETSDLMVLRRKNSEGPIHHRLPPPKEPEYCTPEQARDILKQFGLQSAFRPGEPS